MIADLENVTERVRLGLHYLDGNPDPALGWMPYAGGIITGPASRYTHSEWDSCDSGWRFVEAYLLARAVLGEAAPGEAERRMRRFAWSTLRDDGLAWRVATPWCTPEAFMFDHSRALTALATWLRLEPSDEVAGAARRMAGGLRKIAVSDGAWSVYPAENWTASGWGAKVYAHPPTGMTVEGLTDVAAILGDGALLEQAGREVRAVRTRQPAMFADDGTIVPKGGGPYPFWFTHLHSRLAILLGIAKYARVTADRDLLEWCVRCYRFVRDRLSSSYGWVPESLEEGTDPGVKFLSTRRRDEGCCISDMMQIADLLVDCGHADEISVIERYGTNQLFAHQHVDFAHCRHLMGGGEGTDTSEASYRGMPDRALGGSCLGTYPGDAGVDLQSFGLPGRSIDVAGCCSPAGIKALCLLGRRAVRRDGDRMEVAAWVTVDTPDIAVRSAEPARGELCVRTGRPCAELVLRMPAHVEAHTVRADRKATIRGRAIMVGPMVSGDQVTVTYQLTERVEHESIAGRDYRIRWKGGRVVEVIPTSDCDPYWWRKANR